MPEYNKNTVYYDEEAYHPIALKYKKKDGTPAQCNVACGMSVKDLILVLGCYTAFYTFLFGFSALLLKGVIDTDDTDTLLWAFLVIGILFCVGIGVAIFVGSWTENTKKIKENPPPRLISDEENQ